MKKLFLIAVDGAGSIWTSFFLFISLSVLSNIVSADHIQLPTGFSQVTVTSGIPNPTVMAFADNGDIFVCQQNGKVRLIRNGQLQSTPILSLNVDDFFERGLIGIALHPNFNSNGHIYLYYTLANGNNNRISRFTFNGTTINPNTEQVILNLTPLNAGNHNGGAMKFGLDGKLYVGVGENAKPNQAQSLNTYLGKLLRINPNGSVPPGNPFPSGSAEKKRIWAYGLRNPYTFDIQPGTGTIYVNDVGQNSWEEINDATTGGLNFGWPQAEGNSNNSSFENPVYAYAHGNGNLKGCAITGGAFFNPATTNYPAEYNGKYFFQDFCNNWIAYIDPSNPGAPTIFATSTHDSALAIQPGIDGNLYYLSRGDNALYKIIYTDNSAPAILEHPASLTISAGQAATFTVNASGTQPLSYQWQKNGSDIIGATASSYSIAAVALADAGNYRAVVSNSFGSVTSQAATLTVTPFNANPVAQILTPINNSMYRAGDIISFSGVGTDVEDGSLPASAFVWWVDFHHDDHTHDGPPIANGQTSGTFTIPTTGETSDNVWYRLYLEVEDSGGLKDTVFSEIFPHKSTVSLETVPPGLKVLLDGQPRNTPFSTLGVEGIERELGVVSPQILNGLNYQFVTWQHGGPATQTISTPQDDVTYIAKFEQITGNNCNQTTFANGQAPWAADTIIEAEHFDECSTGISGQNETYFESDTNHTGNLNIRPDEIVDIFTKTDSDGNNIAAIGSVRIGEYWEYSIQIPGGTYRIDARVAAKNNSNQFDFLIDGSKVGDISFPNTGSFKNFVIASTAEFSVSAGSHILTVQSATDKNDIDWLQLVSTTDPCIGNSPPSISISSPANGSTVTAGSSVTITTVNSDPDGTVTNVAFTVNGNPISGDTFNAVEGDNVIEATATDNCGAATTSAPVTVTGEAAQSGITINDASSNCNKAGKVRNIISLSVTGPHDQVTSSRGKVLNDGGGNYRVREVGVAFGSTHTYLITASNGGAQTGQENVTITAVNSCSP